jgi:hypothetical protein
MNTEIMSKEAYNAWLEKNDLNAETGAMILGISRANSFKYANGKQTVSLPTSYATETIDLLSQTARKQLFEQRVSSYLIKAEATPEAEAKPEAKPKSKLKVWRGNKDGTNYTLVATTSIPKAMKLVGQPNKTRFTKYFSVTSHDDDCATALAQPETVFTKKINYEHGANEQWVAEKK